MTDSVTNVPAQFSDRRVRKPRVTLVRGPFVSTIRAASNEATPVVGLAYIAGYIRPHGYDVTIVDAVGADLSRFWVDERRGLLIKGLTFPEIADSIAPDTDVIGFSAMFSAEWPIQRELIMVVRERFPNALLVAGGEHITALPEYSLRDCPALDVCVRGEGEHPFLELLESWTARRDYSDVGGLAYLNRAGEFIAVGNLPRLKDVNSIPWPYWPEGYLEKYWSAGKSYGVCSERDMPLVVSRGCPYQCTFCSSPQMWTTTYKLREVGEVIREIKHYREKYDITAFQLYDLTAIIKKSWTIEFCQQLINEGIQLKWSLPSGTRSEALDEETLSYLKRTGCNYLCYAPESGSNETLKLIKKKVHLDRITASMVAAKRLGLVLRANLVVGFPEERRQDIFQTFRYGLKLAVRGVDEVSLNVYSPYPGSEIFDKLTKAGKVAVNDRYFLSLMSNYTDYTNLKLMTFNADMTARELALWRAAFMLVSYFLGYLLYPSRILRTIRNVFWSSHEAATVFEHRFKDTLGRFKFILTRRLRPTAVPFNRSAGRD